MSVATRRHFALALAALISAFSIAVTVSAADSPLAGTAWKLVSFEAGGKVTTPDDPAKYTLQFEPGGRVFARIDCNRGSGTWEAGAGSELRFGLMAITRAMCPPGSWHDQILKDLPLVRSFALADGRLRLRLEGHGGDYTFAPTEPERSGPKQ